MLGQWSKPDKCKNLGMILSKNDDYTFQFGYLNKLVRFGWDMELNGHKICL